MKELLIRISWVATSLVFTCTVFVRGQSPVDSLAINFKHYRQQAPTEKIYLHTDRSAYLTGETMWFKVYLVDGTLHRLSDMSRVVYLEIVNAAQEPLLQAKISIREGLGDGSLFIPASLGTANYSVRAYTTYMKNFSPDYYFHRTVAIINPFVKPEVQKQIHPTTLVRFFPEGGNLVRGLKNKVAFQVTDGEGKGMSCRGAILSAQNDTIVTFRPKRFGIGSFFFTPAATIEYRAVIVDDKGTRSFFNLPLVQESGYTLQLTQNPDAVEITVAGTAEAGLPVYLFAHTRNMIIANQTKTQSTGSWVFRVPRNEIPEGITHFTVFDEKGRPVCERLYFKPSVKRLSPIVSVEKGSYQLRDRVKMNLKTNSAGASLSVAVYQVDSISPPFKNGIFENLGLTSDLKGSIESPEYYLDTTNPDVQEAADNLMMTHGWRRFIWSEVTARSWSMKYLPETRSHLLSGVVKDAAGAPAAGVLTFMSSPSRTVNLFVSRSNGKGEVSYETSNFTGSKTVIVQAGSSADSTLRVELHDPFSNEYAAGPFQQLRLAPSLGNSLQSRSVDMQVQDIYSAVKANESETDGPAFYGPPDERYYLDDYTRFPVMEEVMREYVPGVLVRKQKDEFRFIVLDNVNKGVFQENPLILLDGVPVMDVDRIMAFSPLKINKLEVLDRRYFLGSATFSGIVSYVTYRGDLGGFELQRTAAHKEYEGLQVQREFYAPVYNDAKKLESRVPDNRSLLYWNRSLTTGVDGTAELEFYTSDLEGEYEVVVEGISKNGEPGSAVNRFKVNTRR